MYRLGTISRRVGRATTRRNFSNVVLEEGGNGVARMVMSKKPVNSLSLEMLTDIKNALQSLHEDKTVQGLIIASDVRIVIFSARSSYVA